MSSPGLDLHEGGAASFPGLEPARVQAVVVGASFGGVEALLALLPPLTPRLRVPLLVVLHQPRDRPGLLAGLLAERCRVPVREAADKDPVEAGTVLVAPSDYHLLAERSACLPAPHVALSIDEPVHFSRPSIDVLFDSAARVWGRGLLALLLTGASSDGAEGLQAVRTAGGQAVVQDPDEARARTMPAAALARGPVEAVLPLARITQLLTLLETPS